MNAFIQEMRYTLLATGNVALVAFIMAWMTVLPSIGLLWLVGVL